MSRRRKRPGYDALIGFRGPYRGRFATADEPSDDDTGPDTPRMRPNPDAPESEPIPQPQSETRILTPAEERRHAFVCKTEGLTVTTLDPARARELAAQHSAGIAAGLRETRLNVAKLRKKPDT